MSYSLEGYVDVAQRIRQLRAKHPEAVLRPYDPANPFRIIEIGGREFIVYTAACYRTPDDTMPAIAVAAEPALGNTNFTKNSEVMNAETSAWGRAIMACLAVDEPHIASANEVMNRKEDFHVPPSGKTAHPAGANRKAKSAPADDSTEPTPQEIAEAFGGEIITSPQPQRERVTGLTVVASGKQLGLIEKLAREKHVTDLPDFITHAIGRSVTTVNEIAGKEASVVIKALMSL